MQGQPRGNRDWEHWPGRGTPDDGIRHRLKALFGATDTEEGVEALIVERGREIEERTEQLQATIADLERREEQTGRLRSAVEEMLRHGSAELDERHAELAALAVELRTRDEQTRAAERDIAVRKQELGAVELRRAAVERREEAFAERETTLDRIAAELTAREERLAEAEARLAELEAEIAGRQRVLAASQASVIERERRAGDHEAQLAERQRALVSTGLRPPQPTAPAEVADEHAHLLYVPGNGGYRIVEGHGPAPAVGADVELDGRRFVVSRLGSSPLPGDRRRCAFVEPA